MSVELGDQLGTSGGQWYCTTTPPSSRLWTWSSFTMGAVWTPQGAIYGRCGPEVGGSELYGTCGSVASLHMAIALVG